MRSPMMTMPEAIAKAKAVAAILPGWEVTEGGYNCLNCDTPCSLLMMHRPLPAEWLAGGPRSRAHFLCIACGWAWHRDVKGELRQTGVTP